MKSYRNYLVPALALASLAPQAWAEKEVVVRRLDIGLPHHRIAINKDDDGEKEKVTYLGVETAPVGRTLGTQLGLTRDVGLVVTNVMEKSPAFEAVKEDDILTKFEDQLLVNMAQLGVLVRSRKEGDEVKLTVVRGGKETSVKVKLGVREVPKRGNAYFFQNGGPGAGGMTWSGNFPPEGQEWLRDLPGMGPEHARDVLRMIGRERGNMMAGPGVRVFSRKGAGSTILDLPKSNISYSDDEGSVEIKVDDGQRTLTVKDAKGKVAFEGPINSDDERKKLPVEIVKRLEKLDSDTFEFEVGENFKPEVVPLPAEAGRTKISRPQGRESGRPAGRATQSF